MHTEKPRTVGREQHRANDEAENASQYWKRSIYLPILENLPIEPTEKPVDQLPGFQVQYFIPTKLPGFNTAAVADIYRQYGDDMVDDQSLEQLGVEVNRWRTTWRDIDGAAQDFGTMLDACNPQFFPGIYCAP